MQKLNVSPVRPEDREEVLALCRNIWGGHDYIPYVFDEWVKEGGFYCGRLNGRIVALDKYTWQESGILWLEGFRVHPDMQGKGIGSVMSREFAKIVGALGCRVMRSMSAEVNEKSRHLAGKKGFYILAEYDNYSLWEEDLKETAGKIKPSGRVKRESDPKAATEFVLSSQDYRISKGLYIANWVAHDISEELIHREAEAGNCYSVRNGGKIEGLIFLYPYMPYGTLSVAFLSGSDDAVEELLAFAVKKAAAEGKIGIGLKTANPRHGEIAERVGIKKSEIGKAFVFEKKCGG